MHTLHPGPQMLHVCLFSRPCLCGCSVCIFGSGIEFSVTMKNHHITKEDSKTGRNTQKITKNSQQTTDKIVIASRYLSIINLSHLNLPIKRLRLDERIKATPIYISYKRLTSAFRIHINWKWKNGKNISPENRNQKRAGVVINKTPY